MQKIVLACLFALWGSCSFAQLVTIKDSETDQPVPLVTLVSQSPKTSVVADANGSADISSFKGSETIEIRMIGFAFQTLSYDELKAMDWKIMLFPSTISLDQVVITSSRWNQSQRDVPAKITTITPKAVALQNPQTAADLLAASGDVYIQKSQQGGGSPMIRGFSTNRVLLTVDGVRMNTAIFRSGNVQNVISLDPFAIERTEVLFGPGSVIYGSDAIGGVMSFSTLTPTLSATNEPVVSGKALGRYSSANGEQTGHFDVNVGWKKWAFVSSFTTSNFGDLRMGKYGPAEYLKPYTIERSDSIDRVVENQDPLVQSPSAYSQINMMQKVRFKPNKHWDFTYAFHYSTTSDYGRYDRHLRTRNGLPRYAEWKYGPQEWMMNNLTIVHSADKGIYDELTVRLAQQHFEESRIDRNLNAATRSIRTERVEAYSATIDLYKNIGARQKLYYGIDGVLNDVTSIGRDENVFTGSQAVGPSRYPQSTWSSYAAYATYQFKLAEDLIMQAGARYNAFALNAKFDTTFYPFPFTKANINNGALTGSVGAVYSPGETWSVRANISTGFRSPNVDDVGKVFDSEPGAVVVPNPNLSAEYAYNAELGIAKVFGDYLKLDATVYYTILENALVRRDYQLNGLDSIDYDGELSQVQAIQNASQATVYGVQAGFEAKLPSGFGLWGRFNYQAGEEELDNGTTSPLRHAAPWFTTAHLTYSVKRLKFDLYGIYNDEVSFSELAAGEQSKNEIYAIDENGDPYSPAWYTLNFKAMVQVSDDLAVSAGLENITDVRYRPYSSGLAGAGRNFIVSARLLF
jgi:hemoglobin/transferrin/lactoferrin receptor protein